ncbi:putative aldouronate transport system permease protein [Paenibacillus sp. 1_12]|uniref:carbohydrate ABC transporter permease n=1 Tax=Paenibacillus sp. 1_12 TaxID=1566278 RepID=UPI0008E6458F|nr:carbohydrate ABC transporter permease [Paenibacillus sp. 1_12]SFK98864.1 putative aldouronate transport system permease protein [Paenibacillus sp. 1_12]
MDLIRRRSLNDILFDGLLYVIASIVLVGVLYPLIFVLSASFSNPESVLNGEMWLLPKELTLDAYKKVLENQDIWKGFMNSVKYALIGTTINITLTLLAAYPLSRADLPGRHLIMFFFVFTMFFSGGLIPTYLVVKNLGMVNTLWAMVIPNAIATYNMIIMRTYFQSTIPIEVQESAWIDGCSNFRLLLYIIIPLSMPIIAVLTLFYGVGHWNAFFNGLIYLRNHDLHPLQLIIRDILILNASDMMGGDASFGLRERIMLGEGVKYAVIIVSSLPVLIVYPFVQRFFIKGVMIGSVKG